MTSTISSTGTGTSRSARIGASVSRRRRIPAGPRPDAQYNPRIMHTRHRLTLALFLAAAAATPASAQQAAAPPTALSGEIDRLAAAVEPELIAWRRHLHEHPELSNREVETSKYVAAQLRAMGLEPQTGVARHGVVAILKGGLPGPVVALRADMDGLPVREETNVPFASKATGEYEG